MLTIIMVLPFSQDKVLYPKVCLSLQICSQLSKALKSSCFKSQYTFIVFLMHDTHTHTHTYMFMCQHINTHAPFLVIIFSDAQNCVYRAVEVVLKKNQCNTNENLYSLILLNPGVHKSQVTASCTVVPNNSVSTVWNLVQPTHVTPRILR